MGQYYLTVNLDKKQYLHPHKFGNGLKLMEFSPSDGLPQALCILLSSGNGRGGGDLHTEGLSDDEAALIGSWAGDRIVVAGDYGDEGLFVTPELLVEWASTSEGTKMIAYWKTNDIERTEPTLFAVASACFEDISDRIIRAVAIGDTPYHPWAAIDGAAGPWREVPKWGQLPKKTPRQPLAGKEAWKRYRNAVQTMNKD